MKKVILFTLFFGLVVPFSGYAQFGIQSRIKAKYEKKYKEEGKKHAQKGLDKAEDKGMEAADKGLNKATDAADPAITKAEEAQKKGEDYAVEGLKSYQDFVTGYENDVNSKDPADYKKYPFETAIVKYKLEGSENGTKTIYIDMGGYKTAEYKTVKERRKEKKTAVMLIGADIISVDFDNKSAVKMHNPMAYLLADPDRDWQKTGEKILINMGYKIVGNETIAGKDCAIWKHGHSKLWVWKGITMKSEDKVMGNKSTETVTDIKIDTKVSGDVFEVPEGFDYQKVGVEDMLPQVTDEDIKNVSEDEGIDDETLDMIEKMTFSEFKAEVRKDDKTTSDEQLKQQYLYLKQVARRRHKK